MPGKPFPKRSIEVTDSFAVYPTRNPLLTFGNEYAKMDWIHLRFDGRDCRACFIWSHFFFCKGQLDSLIFYLESTGVGDKLCQGQGTGQTLPEGPF